MNTLSLFLGAFYFAFQIYCDFSGYSDIAIGISRMLGFDLMKNFNYPYFSRDIAEFWRRWHISLSTWFRDYLYIPLGGSRVTKPKQGRNVFVVFLVSGFWHGANWTFILWGFIHAVFFLPLLLGKRNRKYLDQISEDKQFLSIKDFFQIVSTFTLVMLAWVFFRAENVYTALLYMKRMFMFESFSFQFLSIERYNVEISVLLLSFICFEWFHRKFEHPFIGRFKWHKIVVVILLLLILGVYSDYQQFIYFQF
jgi:D-alanyl-lipoteichoic acid acyltransferase DltB (MBOAT superfamily)